MIGVVLCLALAQTGERPVLAKPGAYSSLTEPPSPAWRDREVSSLGAGAVRGGVSRAPRARRGAGSCPAPSGILFNDLQGAPSACGCGNALCRWTADYGELRTARPSPPEAAARFVAAVKEKRPLVVVIPVWATECEAVDVEQECAGVACFAGRCWPEWSAQLAPVAQEADTLAALLLSRAFARDGERHSPWIKSRIETFAAVPPAHGAPAIAAHRLIAVLQGWDTSRARVDAEIEQTRAAGARGYIVALTPIEQGFVPRVVTVR